jgi:uncharacterized protein (TIGR00255 family)
MIQSMTGFGKAIVETEKLTVTAEVKTLNSKFSDIYCRLPKHLSNREIELRTLLTSELERGKIEFNLILSKTGEVEASVSVNRLLIKAYVKDLQETYKALASGTDPSPSLEEFLKQALTMPNALNTDAQPEADAAIEFKSVLEATQQAIKACKEFRKREGEVLRNQFEHCIAQIAQRLELVIEQDVVRIPNVRERLRKAVTDLMANDNFDQNRFEQELVYYVEKYDISEEKLRLTTHLNYFLEVLRKEGNGKKLNFIGQEIGREINTIGSKANDAIIQRYVVEMKDELEKIKEQTMNIL